MLEYNRPRIADRLQLKCNRTLQPVGQQLLGVSDEEIDFPRGQRLFQQRSDTDVIVLTLDDHFGQNDVMESAGHEAPDENVLDGGFRRAKATFQVS